MGAGAGKSGRAGRGQLAACVLFAMGLSRAGTTNITIITIAITIIYYRCCGGIFELTQFIIIELIRIESE